FAHLVEACGLICIGPDGDVIEQLGNKNAARQLMKENGIPIVPGSDGLIESVQAGMHAAEQIGYPVMLKAANGGGGKGMRIIRQADEFESAWIQARQEAVSCFGNGDMILEKYVENPKHIEVQVAADEHGNIVHLYERDCSFQLGHQKMIEEAPSPALSEVMRRKMCQAAVDACRASGYTSIGTVEFLLADPETFFFMEMNTRIQVEHPITESITGFDLVQMQIEIADGQPLSITQDKISIHGHAMECRITAQSSSQRMAFCTGVLDCLQLPGGRNIRIDSALYPGMEITPFYDSMLCKIIASGSDRNSCIQRMKGALEEFWVQGTQTNEDFLYYALHEPEFAGGEYTTAFAGQALEEFVIHECI
ncbi:MAG: ATP-grasp domain-containing protein, partial [Erysipelotrichaceae bacterium]|nr:ATP-grasp domain-containing protein [Erysipelotrichaceae bacterium]